MEIKIKNNILDSLNFEKNHNLIGKIREKSLEIMTEASIGLSEDFKMEENKLNIAKVICVVTSEDEGENIFKLTSRPKPYRWNTGHTDTAFRPPAPLTRSPCRHIRTAWKCCGHIPLM